MPLRDRLGGLLRSADFAAFRLMVGVRAAFWLLAAVCLLWAPLHSGIPSFPSYNSQTDLIFNTFAQWDAGWFYRIAERGYDVRQSAAFFPLYPLLVRALDAVMGSIVVAGVLISLVSAGLGAVFFSRIARLDSPKTAADSLLLLTFYPIGFVFTSVYSDGLFFALSTAAFLAALRKRSVASGVLAGLAVATRIAGLALLPALIVLLWPRRGEPREWLRLVPPLVCIPGAVFVYSVYLHYHFHDAFAFSHAQSAFWLRHTPTLGPLGGLWDALRSGEQGVAQLILHLPAQGGSPGGYDPPEQWAIWNIVQALLLLAALWLTWVAWKKIGAAYGVYSLATIVILLGSVADVNPLVSIPRFLLSDFPLFLALGVVVENRPRLRIGLLTSFSAVGAVAAVAFSRGVWVA